MDKISIKLDIVGVVIPMTIYRKDEEELRKLAKRINEKAQQVRSLYAVQDVSTLLAMVTLQMALDSKEQSTQVNPQFEQDLQKIHQQLNVLLEESV